MRLHDRLTKLEQVHSEGRGGPAVWVGREPGEGQDEAIARHEAEHGPIGGRLVFMWQPAVKGVCA